MTLALAYRSYKAQISVGVVHAVSHQRKGFFCLHAEQVVEMLCVEDVDNVI